MTKDGKLLASIAAAALLAWLVVRPSSATIKVYKA